MRYELTSRCKKGSKCLYGVKHGGEGFNVTDTKKELIGNVLFKAATKTKSEAMMVKMQPRAKYGEEPPTPIAELMRRINVVFAHTKYSLTHTTARAVATKAGVRIATR